MTLEIGQIIDAKYRVVRRIGEGGMGTVYEGENSRIGRRVAIKVLHAQVAAMPDFVERFEREARAAARIGSPYVCDVLDLGDLPGGDHYIVMEYLDGTSFEDRLVERGRLTTSQLAPIAFELLEGLATMHDARVIHRDLKPANVFLARAGGGRGEKVKILDFGVAKLQPFAGEVGTMTQTGTMMGTPLYMSPEQARGARDVDGRTDIYAASVMFYRALTGVLPYNAETLNELLFKIVLEDPKPLRELAPDVDETFAALVHKGLARDLNQRFETARAYQEAIASWGHAQGRASLSFAVTVPSEPPPPPNASSDAASVAAAPTSPAATAAARTPGGIVGVAAAVTGASAGTPLAWSEGAGGEKPASSSRQPANSSRQAAATILTALDERGTDKLGAAASASAPTGSSSTSTGSADLSSTGAAAQCGAEPPAELVVKATTSAGAPVVVDPVRAVTPASTPERRSRRTLIFAAAGAGAVALIAIVAFGRGDGDRPAPAGMAAVVTGPANATPGEPQPAPSPTTSTATTFAVPGTNAPPESLGAGDASASASASSAAASSSAAGASASAVSAAGASARKSDSATAKTPATTNGTPLTAPPATTSSPASAATAATAGTTAPAASAPRPATSARKFRTTID